MSKASEWAVEQERLYSEANQHDATCPMHNAGAEGCGFSAWVNTWGGCSTLEDGEYKGMTPIEAVALGRWLIDTFGEPEEVKETP